MWGFPKVDNKFIDYTPADPILKALPVTVIAPNNWKVDVGRAIEQGVDLSEEIRVVPRNTNQGNEFSWRNGVYAGSNGVYGKQAFVPPGGSQFILEPKDHRRDLYSVLRLRPEDVQGPIVRELGEGRHEVPVARGTNRPLRVPLPDKLHPNISISDVARIPELAEVKLLHQKLQASLGAPISSQIRVVDPQIHQLVKHLNQKYSPVGVMASKVYDTKEIPFADLQLIRYLAEHTVVNANPNVTANHLNPAPVEMTLGLRERDDLRSDVTPNVSTNIDYFTYQELQHQDDKKMSVSVAPPLATGISSVSYPEVSTEKQPSRVYNSLHTSYKLIPAVGQLDPPPLAAIMKKKTPVGNYPWLI